jgi:integral membrane sensor domain MASE1
MSFDTPKLTTRDYLMASAVLFTAICVLVALVYAIARVVNAWFPVGCTP